MKVYDDDLILFKVNKGYGWKKKLMRLHVNEGVNGDVLVGLLQLGRNGNCIDLTIWLHKYV